MNGESAVLPLTLPLQRLDDDPSLPRLLRDALPLLEAGLASIGAALESPAAAPFVAGLMALEATLVDCARIAIPLRERLLEDGSLDLQEIAGLGVRLGPGLTTAFHGRPGGPGVAVALRMSGGRIGEAGVAMSGIAPLPLRARQVEGTLRGRVPNAALVAMAAQTARNEAQPFGVGSLLEESALEAASQACRDAITLALERWGVPGAAQ